MEVEQSARFIRRWQSSFQGLQPHEHANMSDGWIKKSEATHSGDATLHTKFANPSVNMSINPMIRIVHGNLHRPSLTRLLNSSHRKGKQTHPTRGISFLAAIGNTVPPIEDPIATSPIASPRLFLNQCAITAVVGPKIPPHDIYNPNGVSVNIRDRWFACERTPTANP